MLMEIPLWVRTLASRRTTSGAPSIARRIATALINDNGSYTLSNFVKPNVEVNGAGSLIFFDNGNAADDRDIVVFDGNDANFGSAFDPAGRNINLNGIQYSAGQ